MKKLTLSVWIILGYTLPFILYAQPDTVRVSDGYGSPGSTGNPVDIELVNDEGVEGVQFTLTFDGNLLTVESAHAKTRVSHMDFTYETWTDSIKVLIYSMTGDSILPGTGPIVNVFFSINTNAVAGNSVLLHLQGVRLYDTSVQPIPVVTEDGWFHFIAVMPFYPQTAFVTFAVLIALITVIYLRCRKLFQVKDL
jgi:hypothetical protein